MPSTCYTGGDTGSYKKAPQPGRLLQRHHVEPERLRQCAAVHIVLAQPPAGVLVRRAQSGRRHARRRRPHRPDRQPAMPGSPRTCPPCSTPAPRSSSPGTRAATSDEHVATIAIGGTAAGAPPTLSLHPPGAARRARGRLGPPAAELGRRRKPVPDFLGTNASG